MTVTLDTTTADVQYAVQRSDGRIEHADTPEAVADILNEQYAHGCAPGDLEVLARPVAAWTTFPKIRNMWLRDTAQRLITDLYDLDMTFGALCDALRDLGSPLIHPMDTARINLPNAKAWCLMEPHIEDVLAVLERIYNGSPDDDPDKLDAELHDALDQITGATPHRNSAGLECADCATPKAAT